MARELVDRRDEDGGVIELWRRDEHFDVIVDGRSAMSSDRRRSEESLAGLALAPWVGRDDITVLVGGLGLGYLVRAFVQSPAVARIDVVEASQVIIDWERAHFSSLTHGATRDRRVHVHHGELATWLRSRDSMAALPGGWMVATLDTDSWPELSRPGNALLYADEGLALLEGGLRPGGVVALWSTQRDDALLGRLHARFQGVTRIGVPVEVDGQSSLDYVYRGRRHAPQSGGLPN